MKYKCSTCQKIHDTAMLALACHPEQQPVYIPGPFVPKYGIINLKRNVFVPKEIVVDEPVRVEVETKTLREDI